MPTIAATIVQIRTFVDELRRIDVQPELLPDDMSRVKQLAIERLLMNLSEATTRIPDSEKNRFPDVPWSRIRGIRNKLAHDYEEINVTIIRDVLNSPALSELLDALNQMNPEAEQVRRKRR